MIKKQVPTKLKWLSYNAKKPVYLSEISDDHLHNIIYHINQLPYYEKDFCLRVINYALERGVDVQSAQRYQIPFKNETGQLVTWDYSQGMEGYPR